MINNTLKSLKKRVSLQYINYSPFVKQKQIDDITKSYGTSNWQKIKMYSIIFKHVALQGFKGLKSDFKVYKQLKMKQTLTYEETAEIMRINQDIRKVGPLLIIDILPFTGPLFMLYMYTYPGSIPSWFMIDYYHDKHEELKARNQKKNLTFFKAKALKPQQIDIDTLTLRQLRKLTLLLFGYYRDGTIGYRKLFNQKIQYLIFEGLSRFLIKRDLNKKFKRDLFYNKITNNMQNLNEKVRWRYQKIMNGEFIIEYKPLYMETVSKMVANEGQQTTIFDELEKSDNKSQKTMVKKIDKNNEQK